jgi:hypothetical protein
MSEEAKVTVETTDNVSVETPDIEKDVNKTPEKKTVSKEQFDKTASELASLKKQLQARMTEDELKEAQLVELQETIKGFERDKNITNFTKSLLDSGVETKYASNMAEQLADGDFTSFFNGLKVTIDGIGKRMKAESIKNAPTPFSAASPVGEVTKEQFNKMDFTERQELYTKDPDLYARLVK